MSSISSTDHVIDPILAGRRITAYLCASVVLRRIQHLTWLSSQTVYDKMLRFLIWRFGSIWQSSGNLTLWFFVTLVYPVI